MLFELQRVDRQQPQIVYSGNEMEFELKGLKPVEHLQLRVRAVWLDTEGKRFEVFEFDANLTNRHVQNHSHT
jgi:hypothetical protein